MTRHQESGPNSEATESSPVAEPNHDVPRKTKCEQSTTSRSADRISAKVDRSYKLVPEIGKRWRRWYDIPYRALIWLQSSWRREILPWRLRHQLNKGVNFLLAFNHYERLKVSPLDDPIDNLLIPTGEQVTQGGMWVIEFFPPSFYSELRNALDKNGWDEQGPLRALDGTNSELITRGRREQRFSWSKIGTIAPPDSRYLIAGGKRENLPEEFSLIDLTSIQLGHSLTAIVAFILLSDQGQLALNSAWKAHHEPTLTWRGLRRPDVEDRHFAAISATQRERQRLHDLGRSWLRDRCGGYFSTTTPQQPVVDFSLFAEFDPTESSAKRSMNEPLRALGMQGSHLYNFVSPQLPGAVFVQGEALRRLNAPLRNCWGVIGNHETFARLNDRDHYGPRPYSAATFANMVDDEVRSFLLHTAIVQYTSQMQETFSNALDTARNRHRKFKPQLAEKLGREILASSLDLPAVARDTELFWKRSYPGAIQVKAVPAPEISCPPDEFDFIQQLGDQRTQAFDHLLKEEATYRDVLSTTSALGASASSTRLGQRALFVSATSLLVSATTIITANGAALWDQIVGWF